MADTLDRPRQGALGRISARLGDSLPSPWTVMLGSILLGTLSALSVLLGLYLRNGWLIFSRDAIVLLYFYGAAAGFGPGLTLATFAVGKARAPWRLLIGTVILFLSIHTATAAIFALQYRVFYAHWHADFPSITWGFQLAFTSVGALYQFTVDSLYLYIPLGPVLFAGLGVWFAFRRA
jgi:hypothetical protein